MAGNTYLSQFAPVNRAEMLKEQLKKLIVFPQFFGALRFLVVQA